MPDDQPRTGTGLASSSVEAGPDLAAEFLKEFDARFTPAELPAPTYADLSELVEKPAEDPVRLARSLARLVHDIRICIDLRLDGPLKSTVEDVSFADLPPALRHDLAAALLPVLQGAAADARHKALHEGLPGG